MNLVSDDAVKINGMCHRMGRLPMMPLIFIVCFYYLFNILGISFISGMVVFALSMAINYCLSQVIKKLDKEASRLDDLRMNHTTEALNSMKTLRFYQWTNVFEKEIILRKERQVAIRYKMGKIVSIIIGCFIFFPSLLNITIFSVYIGFGNTMDLPTAFAVIALINMLRGPIIEMPWFVTETLQLLVSMKRIQDYVETDEIDPQKLVNREEDSSNSAIKIDNKSFSWGIMKMKKEDGEDDDSKDKKKVAELEEPLIDEEK